jgi:putative protein-disulfide isomerase
VALTAVSLTAPARELEALKAIQHARYVDGQDVTSLEILGGLLRELGLEEAGALVAQPGADLLAANQVRTRRGQALMQEFGARGVPTLVADSGDKRWIVNHTAFYSNPSALASELEAA